MKKNIFLLWAIFLIACAFYCEAEEKSDEISDLSDFFCRTGLTGATGFTGNTGLISALGFDVADFCKKAIDEHKIAGELDKAKEKEDYCKKLVEAYLRGAKNSEVEAKNHETKGNFYWANRDYNNAVDKYKTAGQLNKAKEIEDYLASPVFRRKLIEESLRNAEDFEKQAKNQEASGSFYIAAKNYYNSAINEYKKAGKLDKAKEIEDYLANPAFRTKLVEEILKIVEEAKNYEKEGDFDSAESFYKDAGCKYIQVGELEKAKELYLKNFGKKVEETAKNAEKEGNFLYNILDIVGNTLGEIKNDYISRISNNFYYHYNNYGILGVIWFTIGAPVFLIALRIFLEDPREFINFFRSLRYFNQREIGLHQLQQNQQHFQQQQELHPLGNNMPRVA